MWRTVFAGSGSGARIQRSSSTSSSMDLINEHTPAAGLNYSLDRTKGDHSELHPLSKKKISNGKLRKKEEKNGRKQQQLDNPAADEQPQDYLSIKSSLIESKKKLTKKLNIKFRQTPSEKIKRRTYENMECAVILNDCNKMTTLLREHPKLNLAHDLRPDGTTLLHTAVRYQCKDALSWLATRCNRFQINQQNATGDSPLHWAVRERSPILVNILLNHRACNHVQNYTNRNTPLLLALSLYIKYRNLKDCACVPGDPEPSGALLTNAASTRSNSTASERSAINDCFCQKKEKSFDLLQLETNNNLRSSLHAAARSGAIKLDLQRPYEQQKENDSSNLKRLISQSVPYGQYPGRNHQSNSKLDDLTADFLNRQNCCPVEAPARSDNEAINNCRLMRKIVMAILHDSDPSSWRLANSQGQTVVRLAKENQVDFVYDFISNYQKLAVIMEPADQNNNHHHLANDALQTAAAEMPLPYSAFKQDVLKAIGQKAVSDGSSEIRAATICDYYLPTFKPTFSKHLQEQKVVEEEAEEFENATMNKTSQASSARSSERAASSITQPAVKSETSSTNQHCPTSTEPVASRFVSSYTNRNEHRNEFNGRGENTIGHSSSSSSSGGGNGMSSCASKAVVNHHKRKTDDEQYCSAPRGQRSIIKADNFLPFSKSSAVFGSAGCAANSINRKSNRSRSITLGNINLLDRNHNLFTSSCSLNRLSELENRKALDHFRHFNNLDHFDRHADQLQTVEQPANALYLPNSFDYFQPPQQQPFEEAPITYSNIPNEFRDCRQFASKQSIGCSKSDSIAKQQSLMNQTNVKTALAVYR